MCEPGMGEFNKDIVALYSIVNLWPPVTITFI